MIEKFSDTNSVENKLSGVMFKELRTFPDDRGFFRELVRHNDPFFEADGKSQERCFAQWSHSKMAKHTVKAWHFHHLQIDWWYVPIGLVHVVLYDNREESNTFKKKIEFYLGDGEDEPRTLSAVVKIPQGVLHGCRVLSEFAHLFYITSRTYDPNDEGRFPFNSELVPHSWGREAELIVAANDRRLFMPTAARVSLAAPV